jgi:hypothetical protein
MLSAGGKRLPRIPAQSAVPSSYSGKRRRSSSAISIVTSRDQPSAALKAAIRTGWLKLIFQKTTDQRLAVRAFLVCIAPSASEPAKIVQHQINVVIVALRYDGRE